MKTYRITIGRKNRAEALSGVVRAENPDAALYRALFGRGPEWRVHQIDQLPDPPAPDEQDQEDND